MNNKNKIKKTLKQHLINLGFKFFDSYDQYDLWKEYCFEKKNIPIGVKNKYTMFLKKNSINRNYRLENDFYDLIGKHKELMIITHSKKSNEIFNSGLHVVSELKENSNILDVGCNSGYLTSFYAKIFSSSSFIGFDKSKHTILQGLKMFNFKKYSNLVLSYDCEILKKNKFNFIIDTQCFSNLKNKELLSLLHLLSYCSHVNVRMISISNLRNEEETRIFLKIFEKKSFYAKSITAILVETLYGVVAYTKIIFTKKKIEKRYDLKSYFNDIRKKISVVNFFNLN